MRIGGNAAETSPVVDGKPAKGTKNRFFEGKYQTALPGGAGTAFDGRLQGMRPAEEQAGEDGEADAAGADRSEAARIYEAAVSGKRNPIEDMRQAPKVPYGHLAKDGVIVYNGVTFVCDEKTNSICLGDMTDKENVLTIALSGGGHLKVNRNSIGLLSRAAGMFTPQDLNLIMRAIAQDSKIQSVQEEIEDEEASVGNRLAPDEVSSPDRSANRSEEDSEEDL